MLKAFINVVLAIAIVEGRSPKFRLENRKPPANVLLPVFHQSDCPDGVKAEYCFNVEGIGMIGVTHISETVFEGTLTGDALDEPISVVVILNQEDNSALINFHHPDIPCAEFDVDLETLMVSCIRAGYDTEEDDEELEELNNRWITAANTNGPIVPLGKDNPYGIDVKVKFTFDKGFLSAFGDEGMIQVIALVKNAYKDQSLTGRIGTNVNIIGEAAKYEGTFTKKNDWPNKKQRNNGEWTSSIMCQKALEGGANYDLYTFITHPGASGVAIGGQACSEHPQWRISFNSAYGENECGKYDPPTPYNCTKPSTRIALTAETIAHELGHSLGMDHDFKSKGPYVYRKYESESEDCGGLMDYIDDGVGWSACSARDFSRYITNGGSSKSCLTSVCSDQLPSGYRSHCSYSCERMASRGQCNWYWSERKNSCFDGTPPDGKVKEYCKLSCGDCPCTGGNSCCTSTNKCGEDEGDCDNDSDCNKGLKCGKNNCSQKSGFQWGRFDDCCYRPATCTDTANGAVDKYGDGCDAYARNLDWCGYNDAVFQSDKMCCACKGSN